MVDAAFSPPAHHGSKARGCRPAFAVPVPVVSALLGHALPGVTGLYVQADQKVLRSAMEDVWSDLDTAEQWAAASRPQSLGYLQPDAGHIHDVKQAVQFTISV